MRCLPDLALAHRNTAFFQRFSFISVIALLLSVLHAADVQPPADAAAHAADGYRFTVGKPLTYAYEVRQDVGWESAGDKLAFTSTLLWKLLLVPQTVTPERVTLAITVLRVKASQRGPGVELAADSAEVATAASASNADPLLGPLLAAEGVTLTLDLDPRSGVVSAVSGGEQLVAAIDKQNPSRFAGDPPPLHAGAVAAYSSAALARLWSGILALPAAGTQALAMGPPLDATVERTWTGSTYTLALPTNAKPATGTLANDPTPVSATLKSLAGSGALTLVDGLPTLVRGELTYDLSLSALTQPVTQHHKLNWQLTALIGE